ncbi:MAG: endonuclease [Bacteroidota bacterium]
MLLLRSVNYQGGYGVRERKQSRATGKHILFILFLFNAAGLFAQPAGYYSPADGKEGKELQQVLHEIIRDHTSKSYDYLWTAFQSTDKKTSGYVWDIYSDIPGGSPVYNYTFISDQCGNYSSEGDCYNREHSFPKSWFNDAYPMYSDLFHLYPTDGYVNGKRSNYPFGETSHPTWTSTNGSKLGPCDYPGYSGTIFEPIDEYKGDLARTYFYMATRYLGEDASWPGSDMVDGSQPVPWALNLLLEWHTVDPVSQKELDRNNAIYAIQANRNPFIDHPEFAGLIWGGQTIPKDTLAPVLDSMEVRDGTHLVLWFSEILDSESALQSSNYAISGGVSVSGVSFNQLMFSSVVLEVTGMLNGEYILTVNGVADQEGNTAEGLAFPFEYFVSGLGVSAGRELSLYPNPACDNFTLSLPESDGKVVSFGLYSLSGVCVSDRFEHSGTSTCTVDCSDVAPGCYLLRVVTGNAVTVLPVIISR